MFALNWIFSLHWLPKPNLQSFVLALLLAAAIIELARDRPREIHFENGELKFFSLVNWSDYFLTGRQKNRVENESNKTRRLLPVVHCKANWKCSQPNGKTAKKKNAEKMANLCRVFQRRVENPGRIYDGWRGWRGSGFGWRLFWEAYEMWPALEPKSWRTNCSNTELKTRTENWAEPSDNAFLIPARGGEIDRRWTW